MDGAAEENPLLVLDSCYLQNQQQSSTSSFAKIFFIIQVSKIEPIDDDLKGALLALSVKIVVSSKIQHKRHIS